MRIRKLITDLSMPFFFLILSVYILIESGNFSGQEGVFPRLIGIFMLIVSIFIFFTTLKQNESKVSFKKVNIGKVAELVAVLALYIALMKHIGYAVDTFLFCGYAMVTLGFKKYKRVALYSAVTTTIVFVIFKVLLHVPLPLLFLDF